MSAVQDAIRQRQRRIRRIMRWPWCWPLLAMPLPVIVYVLSVVAVDTALAGPAGPATATSDAAVSTAATPAIRALVSVNGRKPCMGTSRGLHAQRKRAVTLRLDSPAETN